MKNIIHLFSQSFFSYSLLFFSSLLVLIFSVIFYSLFLFWFLLIPGLELIFGSPFTALINFITLVSKLVNPWRMVEGTRDFKKLEGMIKEVDQKRERDSARVDAALGELKAMIQALTVPNDDRRTQEEGVASRGSILGNPAMQGDFAGQQGGNLPFRYAAKLEFPKFNGEGVEEWLFKVEQIFLLDRIGEQTKISVVSLHLEGSALHWHKSYIKLKGRIPLWGEYVLALKARFGALSYEDPMAEIKKLRQTGSLKDYLQSFDVLLDKVQLSEEQALSCFLAGLKHEMEVMVRMFNPKSLQEAYSLAKLQDSLKQVNQVGGKGLYSRPQVSNDLPSFGRNIQSQAGNVKEEGSKNTNQIWGGKRPLSLTPKQMEEKRLKNLCFWCDERFTPGHRCKNKQLYMIIVHDDEEEGDSIHEDEGEKPETMAIFEGNPQLSIHAMEGTYSYQTMRLRGAAGKRMLCILIDSGSTHNFIDVRMATKLGCVVGLLQN